MAAKDQDPAAGVVAAPTTTDDGTDIGLGVLTTSAAGFLHVEQQQPLQRVSPRPTRATAVIDGAVNLGKKMIPNFMKRKPPKALSTKDTPDQHSVHSDEQSQQGDQQSFSGSTRSPVSERHSLFRAHSLEDLKSADTSECERGARASAEPAPLTAPRHYFRRESRPADTQSSSPADTAATRDSDGENDDEAKAVVAMELNRLLQQQDETSMKLEGARAALQSLQEQMNSSSKPEAFQKHIKTAAARVAKYEKRQQQTQKSIVELQTRPKRNSYVSLQLPALPALPVRFRRGDASTASSTIPEDHSDVSTRANTPPTELQRRSSNLSLPAVTAPVPAVRLVPPSASPPVIRSELLHSISAPVPVPSGLQRHGSTKKRVTADPQRAQNELDIMQLMETTNTLSERITAMAAANSELLQTIERLREKASSRDAELASLQERLKSKEEHIERLLGEQRAYVLAKVKAIEAQAEQSKLTVNETEAKINQRQEQLARQQADVAKHLAMIDQINDTLGPKPAVWQKLKLFVAALCFVFLALLLHRFAL